MENFTVSENTNRSSTNRGITSAAADAYWPQTGPTSGEIGRTGLAQGGAETRIDIPKTPAEPGANEIPKTTDDDKSKDLSAKPHWGMNEISRSDRDAAIKDLQSPVKPEFGPKSDAKFGNNDNKQSDFLPQLSIEDLSRTGGAEPGELDRNGNPVPILPDSVPTPYLPGIRLSDLKMTHPLSPVLDYGWVPDGMIRGVPANPNGPKRVTFRPTRGATAS